MPIEQDGSSFHSAAAIQYRASSGSLLYSSHGHWADGHKTATSTSVRSSSGVLRGALCSTASIRLAGPLAAAAARLYAALCVKACSACCISPLNCCEPGMLPCRSAAMR